MIAKLPTLVPFFHHNERNAIDNQHDGHHDAVVQVRVHPVVKQHAHHAGGDDGGNDLEPQRPGLLLLLLVFTPVEGVEFSEKQGTYSQNRPQLNHHIEHTLKFFAHVQVNKFIQQNQVSGRGYREPLCNALHDAKQHRL